MRNYLDSYMISLTKREQVLARNFIWADRRHISGEMSNLSTSITHSTPRFVRAFSMQRVDRFFYAGLMDNTKVFLESLFDQVNSSAHIRTSLNEQTEIKLSRIESALQNLEQEVDDWEEILCSTPEAVHTIRRNFGSGLRPLLETPSTLNLLSLVIESNVDTYKVGGYMAIAIENDRISEPLFTTSEGLQLRFIYTFTPGLVDKIRLEPVTGLGELTMLSLRVYGAQGNLVSTITEDEILNRTLDYSIPKTIVSRIEVDIIDRTYVIEEITTVTTVDVDTNVTGEKRTVIPGYSETILVGYDTVTTTTTTTSGEADDPWGEGGHSSHSTTGGTNKKGALLDSSSAVWGWYREPYIDTSLFNDDQKLFMEIIPGRYAYNANWELSASNLRSQVMPAGYDPSTQAGSGYQGQPYGQEYFDSLAEAFRSTNAALTGFVVKNEDGTFTKYWYQSNARAPRPVEVPEETTTTTKIPIYETINIPERILIEPFSNSNSVISSSMTMQKRYHYEGGLRNLVCTNSFYTEALQYAETICFDGGIPTYITLTTDEYLPHGSHVNFYIIGNNKEVIPLCPEKREFTTDILRFDQYGQAELTFYPEQELYYYKDEASTISFPTNGKYVMGPTNNTGAINTLGGSVFWARYQPNHGRSNYIPYTSRVAAYVSPDGILGEAFDRIPEDSIIVLKETPFIDSLRLSDTTYSPVQITIDGYNTMDLTNYYNYQEEEFPVEPRYEDDQRMITYKTRGKTIFFEEPIDRPVRIFYEYVRECVKFVIEMGVIHGKAACPVLYGYSMSHV